MLENMKEEGRWGGRWGLRGCGKWDGFKGTYVRIAKATKGSEWTK